VWLEQGCDQEQLLLVFEVEVVIQVTHYRAALGPTLRLRDFCFFLFNPRPPGPTLRLRDFCFSLFNPRPPGPTLRLRDFCFSLFFEPTLGCRYGLDRAYGQFVPSDTNPICLVLEDLLDLTLLGRGQRLVRVNSEGNDKFSTHDSSPID